jgi:hypothetical protein
MSACSDIMEYRMFYCIIEDHISSKAFTPFILCVLRGGKLVVSRGYLLMDFPVTECTVFASLDNLLHSTARDF